MIETPLDIQLFHKLVDEAAQRGISGRDMVRCLNAATPMEIEANARGAAEVIMELFAKDGNYTHFMAASPRGRALLFARLLLRPPAQGKKQKSKRRGMSPRQANTKAVKLAKKDPNFVNQGARKWAKAIGCSVSTVQKTELWRATMRQWARGRSRGPTPKAVSMTPVLEKAVGVGDRDAILELIAQQEADSEPSPLDPALTRRPPRLARHLWDAPVLRRSGGGPGPARAECPGCSADGLARDCPMIARVELWIAFSGELDV